MSDLPSDPAALPFVPFPKRAPAQVGDTQLGTLWSLCWSEDWNPYVLTALKVLARPETYTGSEIDVIASARNGEQLLANIHEFCAGNFSPPAFYLVQEDVNCVMGEGLMQVRAVDNCADQYLTWFGRCYYDIVGNVARVGVRALDLIDDVQVGGHFCSVHGQALGSASNPPTITAWTLDWIDCDGNPQQEIDATGGETFDFIDFVAQRACLQVVGGDVSGICVTYTINGPVLCRYP